MTTPRFGHGQAVDVEYGSHHREDAQELTKANKICPPHDYYTHSYANVLLLSITHSKFRSFTNHDHTEQLKPSAILFHCFKFSMTHERKEGHKPRPFLQVEDVGVDEGTLPLVPLRGLGGSGAAGRVERVKRLGPDGRDGMT
jgi:hypothetical protein